MEIKICLYNWEDYTAGIESWRWFTFPEDAHDMREWIDNMHSDGKKNIFIYWSNYSFINESTDIEALVSLSNHEFRQIIKMSGYEPAYEIERFDELLEEYTPSEIKNMVYFGRSNPADDYFKLNDAGNIETMSADDYELYLIEAFNEGAREFLHNY